MFSQNEGIPNLYKIYANYLHIALAVFYISREHFFFLIQEDMRQYFARTQSVFNSRTFDESSSWRYYTANAVFLRQRARWPSVNDTTRIILPLESVFWLSISTGLNGGRRSSKGDYSNPFPKVQNLCYSISDPGSFKPILHFFPRDNDDILLGCFFFIH